MRNQNDEAPANEHAESEGKAHPAYDWRNIVGGTFYELFDRSWIQNLVIGIAILALSPLVVLLFMKTGRGMLFGFGIGITILFWIFWWTLIQRVAPNLDTKPNASLETPTPMNKDDKPNISITSHNQSGGFTGVNQGTVNLGPQSRMLSMDQGSRMARALASQKATARIEFWYVTGDEETSLYGQEIMALLKNGGFDFASVNTAGMAAGIPSGLTIYVRDVKTPPRDAVRIADCLKSEGVQFNVTEDAGLDAHAVKVWVSIRPTL